LISWLNTNRISEENKLYDLVNNDNLENFKNNLFKQFQVDLTNEIKSQFYYLKYTNLQPTEIKQFDFWEWQMMLQEMKDYIEKEKEEHDKQNGQNSYKNTGEYKDMMSQMRSYGVDPGSGKATGGRSMMPSNFSGSGLKIPKI
jgi:hypothetical protein